MKTLYQKFEILIDNTPTGFTRYLYNKINWDSRMIGIIGARGVGKTTMVLQHIKQKLDSKDALYVSADDMYFGENKIIDLADSFYKNSGKYLFIDEIHKYPEWSRELKNIYDSYPDLKIIFTGSSILDILKGSSDLSRRAIVYKLQGLSFREYLNFFHNLQIKSYTLNQILNDKIKLKNIKHPLPLFNDYLKQGYYPFGIEEELNLRLGQIIIQTLDTDIPQYANFSVSTSRKLKHLLSIIAESVPFKPNFSKIAEIINVSRNSLEDYFHYMEQAGLISQLRDETKGIRGLGKVNKVYLDNTNIVYNLVDEKADIGNIRETFFFNQMRVNNEVISSKKSDFIIEDLTFEVGGKGKQQNQIDKNNKSYIVKDNIEYAYLNVIPLWTFGLNY